jgi:hypothetical protein
MSVIPLIIDKVLPFAGRVNREALETLILVCQLPGSLDTFDCVYLASEHRFFTVDRTTCLPNVTVDLIVGAKWPKVGAVNCRPGLKDLPIGDVGLTDGIVHACTSIGLLTTCQVDEFGIANGGLKFLGDSDAEEKVNVILDQYAGKGHLQEDPLDSTDETV